MPTTMPTTTQRAPDAAQAMPSTMPSIIPESVGEVITGKPVDRVDGRDKVTGNARYAADFPVKYVAHAVAFGSTIASGRVVKVNVEELKKLPGVIDVLTHENAGELHRVSLDHKTGKPGQTKVPLQDDKVEYVGQYVGVVIAETMTQALEAARLGRAEYADVGKPVAHMDHAMDKAFVPKKLNHGEKPQYTRGDVATSFDNAAIKIDQTYQSPIENHNPMELHATIAEWNKNRLTLHDATQWVLGTRSVVSTWLGLPADTTRVIAPYLGGGFGCKGSIWPHTVLAAQAAKLVGRPVKLVLRRDQMFYGVGYRPHTIQRVQLGADATGKLVSIAHDVSSQTSMWRDEWIETSGTQTQMLYSCLNVRTSQKLVPVNANTPTQMRAPGHMTGTFALEVAMDELAYAANVDPIELRLINYAEQDESGDHGPKPFSSKALRECYKQGAERFGWSKRSAKPGSMRDGEWRIGYGMATATYPTNQQRSSAKVSLGADGKATVKAAGHDLGTGAYTVMTQLAAETLGLAVADVKVYLGDSELPPAPVAGGSQTTASLGSAVLDACQVAVADLFERAAADPKSPLFERQAKELKVGKGRVYVAKSPGTGETIAALLTRNGGRPIDAEGSGGPPAGLAGASEDAGSGKPPEPYSKHAFGAQFCEVAVHARTGEVRVRRFVGAFGGGRILNEKTARSQMIGGIVWGIGAATHEQTVYDPRSAKVVNDNIADYLIPVNPDVPAIDAFFVDEPDPHVNTIGVKGIGELGNTGSTAAVVNAIYHATGIRIRELPVTPDKLLL